MSRRTSRSTKMITVCAAAGTWMATGAAHAATYYVAPNGDNDDAGTESEPWRTIAHAVNRMEAGDTTYVRGGTYKESTIRFKKSGTANAPIKLLNYAGESPVIDFVDKKVDKILWIYHGSGQNVPIGHITVEGFEIKNAYVGIKFYSMHNSVIRRNWIHNAGHQGILGGGGHHNLYADNIINHNGNFDSCGNGTVACNQAHGLYMHGKNYTIINNLIYDNLSYGVTHNGSPWAAFDSSKHPNHDFAGAENWLIANNTFAYQNHRGGIVEWGHLLAGSRIENNIFYENAQKEGGTNGVSFSSMTSTGIVIRNNLSFATSPGGTGFLGPGATEGVHYTQSNNLVNVSPPGFVGAPATVPASPNFELTADSPAIDSGLALSEVTVDFAGVARPQGAGYDIGAYEWCAEGSCGAGEGTGTTASTGSGAGSGSTSNGGTGSAGNGVGSTSGGAPSSGTGGMDGGLGGQGGGGDSAEDGDMVGSCRCSVGAPAGSRDLGLLSVAALAWLVSRQRRARG